MREASTAVGKEELRVWAPTWMPWPGNGYSSWPDQREACWYHQLGKVLRARALALWAPHCSAQKCTEVPQSISSPVYLLWPVWLTRAPPTYWTDYPQIAGESRQSWQVEKTPKFWMHQRRFLYHPLVQCLCSPWWFSRIAGLQLSGMVFLVAPRRQWKRKYSWSPRCSRWKHEVNLQRKRHSIDRMLD